MGRILPGAVVGAMLLLPAAALAQDQGKAEAAGGKIKVEKVLRTSTIKGMKVYNNQGDRVGTLDELVIDIEKGQVVYAALSVGGLLGVGDKLFAIPWREFTYEVDEKDKFLRIDVNKDALKAAPGFAKDQWPNTAEPNWNREIEQYWKERPTTRRIETKERRTTTQDTRR
jgi:sporulation protein YlmC with PRC-barrel domain